MEAVQFQSCIIAAMMRPESKGGAATHMRTVKKFLSGHLNRIEIVSPVDAPSYLVYPVFAIRAVLMRLNRAAGTWWFRRVHFLLLRSALKRRLRFAHPPTILYAQCPLSARAALETRAKADKVAMVVHFNDSQADEMVLSGAIAKDGRLYDSIRSLEESVIPKVDLLVFLSDYMRQQITRRIPAIAGVPSAVIPNFVEPSDCEPSSFKGDFISLGLLVPRKNNRFTLQVLYECARLGYKFTLSIVGEGPERAQLEQLCSRLGLQEQVHFHGDQANPLPLLKSHRVLLHASKLDNMPYALLEALSCSQPIVAARVGGIPEILSGNENGVFWDLEDPEGSAQLLIRLMTDGAFYDRLSEGAWRTYDAKFSARSVSARFLAALTDGNTERADVDKAEPCETVF